MVVNNFHWIVSIQSKWDEVKSKIIRQARISGQLFKILLKMVGVLFVSVLPCPLCDLVKEMCACRGGSIEGSTSVVRAPLFHPAI